MNKVTIQIRLYKYVNSGLKQLKLSTCNNYMLQ